MVNEVSSGAGRRDSDAESLEFGVLDLIGRLSRLETVDSLRVGSSSLQFSLLVLLHRGQKRVVSAVRLKVCKRKSFQFQSFSIEGASTDVSGYEWKNNASPRESLRKRR